MIRATDPANIVDLQQRQVQQAAAGERMGDLLKRVRAIAQKRIHALVAILFENVDDALFDLAGRAQSNAAQTQFFDGMREVRKKRQLVERVFQDQLATLFQDFAAGKLKARSDAPMSGAADPGLALVDNQELEESLAVSSMVSKAENRLARHLFTVNRRLSVISGGNVVEDAGNPIAPGPLGNAFRVAVRELDLDVPVKLIIYKLYDRYVMTGLESIYDEVNAELIAAGVLPQIRHTVGHAGHGHSPGTAAAGGERPAYAQEQSPDQGYDAGASELQAELYGQLRSLLAGRHQSGPATTDRRESGGVPLPSLSATELLNALSILQIQNNAPHAQGAVDTADAVQQMKQELLEQVRKLGGDARSNQVSSTDEDTIDLVGMLFEFIVEDRNLPAHIQALLGRLQIPYLKVAILDKHLFAQKAHPARRLLDALAIAGVGWSEESDHDHRLYNRIRAVVETILREFDEDLSLFARELTGFEDFLEQNRRRAELAEQRTAENTRGREKLLNARQVAGQEILNRIGQRDLPPVIHQVLSRPWANYLVLTLLRHGEESDEWKRALRFADEFVWSALPKQSEADKTRLRALLPQLEKALRAGLAAVAYHDNELRVVMQQLQDFYGRVLNDQQVETKSAQEVIAQTIDVAATDGKTAGGTAAAANPSPVEEIVLRSGESEAAVTPEEAFADDDEHLQAARDMKVGTWVEFIEENDQRERAKLSWISPISSKYLFVNRRGLKVCDKSLFALATELRRGSTLILEEVPLFDRALDAIVERLRQTHAAQIQETPTGDESAASSETPPA